MTAIAHGQAGAVAIASPIAEVFHDRIDARLLDDAGRVAAFTAQASLAARTTERVVFAECAFDEQWRGGQE